MNTPGAGHQQYTLLYIDDEPALLEIGRLFLERSGDFIVTTVGSAEDAVRLLVDHRFDAIVSDYLLSGMHGIDLLRHLRSTGDTTPFILLTARGREDLVIEAVDEGVDYYVQKSGSPSAWSADLIRKIHDAIVRRRMRAGIDNRQTFQDSLMRIAAGFVGQEDFDTVMNEALSEIGTFSGASRSYIFLFRQDQPVMDNTHEWCREGVSHEMENLQGIPRASVPWWMERLTRGEDIRIPKISLLPNEASAEKELLLAQGIESLIVLPLTVKGLLIGFIGLDNVFSGWGWSDEDIRLLRISANLIAGAIERERKQHDLQVMNAELQAAEEEMRVQLDELVETHTALWKSERHLKHRLAFEKVIGRISSSFVHCNDADPAADQALAEFGAFCHASRACIIVLRESEQFMDNISEWCADDLSPVINPLQGIPADACPWLMEKMRNNEIIHITETSRMPPEAIAEKKLLLSQGIQAMIVLPLLIKGGFIGYIGLEYAATPRKWSDEDLELLRIASELFASAIEQRRSDLLLRRRMEFEHLITTISSAFVGADPSDTDDLINDTLVSIGRFTGVDRAYVFLLKENGDTIENTHEWCAEGIRPEIQDLGNLAYLEVMPWFTEKILNGEIVSVSDINKLPGDALSERRYCGMHGVQSLILLPIRIGRRIFGILGFDSVRTIRTWTEDDQTLISIVSDIIAHAINKREAALALRESQERLQMALSASGTGMWELDLPSMSLSFDDHAAAIFGYNDGRFFAESIDWKRFTHPDDIPDVTRIINDYLEGRRTLFETEHRMRHGDGTWIWISGIGKITRWHPDGLPLRLSGTLHDITRRKEMDEALHKREELERNKNRILTMLVMQEDLDLILDAIVLQMERSDPSIHGSILLFDEARQCLVHTSAPNLPDEYNALLQPGLPIGPDVGSCGSAAYLRDRVVVADIRNSPRWTPYPDFVRVTEKYGLLACWSQPILTSDGKLLGTIANYADAPGEPDEANLRVLEWAADVAALAILQKQADDLLRRHAKEITAAYEVLEERVRERTADLEEALHQQRIAEERFKTLFREMLDGFVQHEIIFNEKGKAVDFRITAVNPAFEKMIGIPADDMEGQTILDLLPELRDSWADIFQQVADTGVPVIFENCLSDNQRCFKVSAFRPEPDQLACIFEDITEEKRIDEEMRRSLLEKEVLIKEIHHRVKNNMQVVSGLLTLQRKNINDDTIRKLFLESESRIFSLALVHEKLYQSKSLSRIEYGQYLSTMGDYILGLSEIGSDAVSIEIDAPDIYLSIEKAVPLSLITNEFIMNSLKHAFPDGRKGRIILGMKRKRDTIVYRYHDDGVGVPAGVDYAETSSLGLQLVNSLVIQLMGTISMNRDQGTTFIITFPVAPDGENQNE
ncbi:GAF domain-containing protein [Methanocalculus chunghsingensis]|uniref:GAF domain-containing protein n=1 Tax=Methanocalculus chunghsingensis TaxID=156457 RepID=UPI001B8ACDD8|nr:GAF domain-containing protein [Methanocalculus chunghsingensis]